MERHGRRCASIPRTIPVDLKKSDSNDLLLTRRFHFLTATKRLFAEAGKRSRLEIVVAKCSP